jgi:nitrate reductase alpha subunit
MYSNWVRRLRGSSRVIEHLLPQLKVFAVLDWRMSSTTRWADYVLPVATWYERTDHKWVTPLSPFHHTSEQATEPAGESWSDWRIIATLAKKLEARARERGMAPVQGARGGEVRFDRLYREFTMDGRFTELDEAAVARALVEASSTLAHLDWDELLRRGFGRHRGTAYPMDNMCEIEDDQTIVPLTFHVRDKVPYPTATRRIQFHLDHPLYEELDEVLPRHKTPPTIGGEHPLYMTGGHTRWSIHSAWRDDALMLRLQRGAPFVLLSLEDAAARGIADGERVRVRNDLGAFEVRAKLAPQLRPGQAIVYHGWEDNQFRGPGNPRHLLASPINPVELAGGHPHLVGSYNHGTPGQFDRETRIEVERIAPGTPA